MPMNMPAMVSISENTSLVMIGSSTITSNSADHCGITGNLRGTRLPLPRMPSALALIVTASTVAGSICSAGSSRSVMPAVNFAVHVALPWPGIWRLEYLAALAMAWCSPCAGMTTVGLPSRTVTLSLERHVRLS